MIHEMTSDPLQDGYHAITIATSRGRIAARYYPAPEARRAAVWVGGVGGDWDTPAQGLYPRLCEELVGEGIASLRVQYRHPTRLEECILDVLAGLHYLETEGCDTLALIGHSLGGAVVIQAAAASPTVRTVVTLATQSYGADPAAQLGPRCSILLLHGQEDQVLGPVCSAYVYQIAQEPKRLIVYPNADHGLDSVAGEVHQVVRDWVVERLKEAVG